MQSEMLCKKSTCFRWSIVLGEGTLIAAKYALDAFFLPIMSRYSSSLLTLGYQLTTFYNQEVLDKDVRHADMMGKLDLAFNNVKPKDWYFVLDQV